MYRSRRWLAVAAAVLLVGTLEALSDTAFDALLPFPFHTLFLVAVVGAVAAIGAWLAFRQIDRLTGDLRERNDVLASRNDVLRALYDTSLAVAGQADPDQTIAVIVDHARTLLRADAALLALDGPAGELRLRAARAGPGVLLGDEPAAGGVMALAEDDLGCFLRAGYEIRLATPVGLGDMRVGMLGVAVPRALHRRFGTTETETLAALATQAGLALEAARLQGQLKVVAVQGERERIAREMHDGLAQVLGYVNTKSQATERCSPTAESPRPSAAGRAGGRGSIGLRGRPRGDPQPVAAGAAGPWRRRGARGVRGAVRGIVQAGRPIPCQPEAAGAPLSAAVQAEVFSIAREALTNVRKHARPAGESAWNSRRATTWFSASRTTASASRRSC
jgi:signal transduction histidine kinase